MMMKKNKIVFKNRFETNDSFKCVIVGMNGGKFARKNHIYVKNVGETNQSIEFFESLN
jgi:histidyl-tRNA synthetase